MTAGLLAAIVGLLAATAGVAALAPRLAAALVRVGPWTTASTAGAEGLRIVPAGLPDPSPVALVALAVAAWWPAAIVGAHLLAVVLARR